VSHHDPVCPLHAQETGEPAPWLLVFELHPVERESTDIHATNGKDYEVKVNARNGKVIAIIIGG